MASVSNLTVRRTLASRFVEVHYRDNPPKVENTGHSAQKFLRFREQYEQKALAIPLPYTLKPGKVSGS